MEKRIELEKRGRACDEIEELNLDNCRATQIAGLTDEFVNLETLSLINNGLTTLKGFPNLPNLRKIELSDNRLSGGLNFLHGCPKLTLVNLSGNKFADYESLEPLKAFKELKSLDLHTCEVSEKPDYREKVFEMFEGLLYLDGFDRDNEEAEEDDEDDDEFDESKDVNDGGEDDEDDDGSDDDDEDSEDDLEGGDDGDDDLDEEGSDDEGEGGEDAGAARGTKRKHEEEEEEEEEDA